MKNTAQMMELIDRHGPNPQMVGVEDDTEDDFGDLLWDVAEYLGISYEDDARWQHFQEVALECLALTMAEFVGYIDERTVMP